MGTLLGQVTRSNNIFSWKIDLKKNFSVSSPFFCYKGCSWYIRVSRDGKEKFFVVLARALDEGPETISVSFALLFNWDNEAAVEKLRHLNYTFRTCSYRSSISNPFLLEDSLNMADLSIATITCHFLEGDGLQQSVKPQLRRGGYVKLEALSADFLELLRSRNRSDVVLKVQGRDFPAHKVVLEVRSPVFRAIFSHDSEEEKTGVVTIPDCDPDSFSLFLSFLYSGRVGELTMDSALQLYVTSDKYDVQALKSICRDHLKRNLTPERRLRRRRLGRHSFR